MGMVAAMFAQIFGAIGNAAGVVWAWLPTVITPMAEIIWSHRLALGLVSTTLIVASPVIGILRGRQP